MNIYPLKFFWRLEAKNPPRIAEKEHHLKHPGSHFYLAGGWTTHLKNMRTSNWIISPSRGIHKQYLKPPPSYPFLGFNMSFSPGCTWLGKILSTHTNPCAPSPTLVSPTLLIHDLKQNKWWSSNVLLHPRKKPKDFWSELDVWNWFTVRGGIPLKDLGVSKK